MPDFKKPKFTPIEHFENVRRGHTKEIPDWMIKKINAEFVKGFKFLSKFRKAVSILGTARSGLKPEIYDQATKLAHNLSDRGFAIITGGGPGIMEAAN